MSNPGRYRKLEKRLRDLNSAVESMAYNVDCLSAANNGSLVGLSQSMACFVASTHAVRSSLCTPEIAREELKRPAEVIEHLDGRTISPNPVLPYTASFSSKMSTLHRSPTCRCLLLDHAHQISQSNRKGSVPRSRKKVTTLAEMRERAQTPKVRMHKEHVLVVFTSARIRMRVGLHTILTLILTGG